MMGALSSESCFILSCTNHSLRYINFGPPRVAQPRILHEEFTSVKVRKVLRRSFLQLIGIGPIFANSSTLLAAPVPEMKEPDIIRTLKLASGVRIQGHGITLLEVTVGYTAISHQYLAVGHSRSLLGVGSGCDGLARIKGYITSRRCCIPSLWMHFSEIVEGDGKEAHEGDLVEVNYVCRRSNGYFVHSTVDQFSGESAPVVIPLDDKQIINGLKEVLIGMRAGGKRRALIPPSVGYISENLKPLPEEFGPRRSLLSHAKEPLIFEVQLLKVL